MTPEIIARVDAWLIAASDRGWETPRDSIRDCLCSQWWNRCAEKKAHEAWPNTARAVEAAMSGILLALVREAWPGCNVSVDTKWERVPDGQGGLTLVKERTKVEIRWPCGGVSTVWFNRRSFLGESLAEALATALEAAPLPGQAVQS